MYVFYIYGFIGFLISLSGFLMSPAIEADSQIIINLSLK